MIPAHQTDSLRHSIHTQKSQPCNFMS